MHETHQSFAVVFEQAGLDLSMISFFPLLVLHLQLPLALQHRKSLLGYVPVEHNKIIADHVAPATIL